MTDNILLVEDDLVMADTLRNGLEYNGYAVTLVTDGEAAVRFAVESRPALVMLDVMLPRLDGVSVCMRLRERKCEIPILMLTARKHEMDKVRGLKSGADDYVTKPFSFLELLARVEALLRRSKKAACARYSFGDVSVDFERYEATKGRDRLTLSHREFEILRFFVEHHGAIVTRDQLLHAVWGKPSSTLTRTVDVHVGKLRRKLGGMPDEQQVLLTVPGGGYKFIG